MEGQKQVKHRFFKDILGFLLETSHPWAGRKDDGRGDAIARTVLAAIVYGEKIFIQAVETCFHSFIRFGQWAPMRHPEDPRTEDFSRDHTVWFVIWLRYFHPEWLQKALQIPWRISQKAKMGPHIWLWIRAVAKKIWFWNFLHWLLCEVWLTTMRIWDDFLLRRAGIVSQDYRDFKPTPEDQLSRKELQARKWIFPSYAIDTLAMQVKCLPEGWFRERLKNKVIALVEPTNWYVRKLMDDAFTNDEVYAIKSYTGMDAFRGARRLDKTCNIPINALSGPQPEYNMDIDVLQADFE